MPSLAEIIEPRPGKLAVLIDPREEVTTGGLYIPIETAASLHVPRPTQGTIVAIGEEDLEEPDITDLKIGDRVIFGKYSGVEIKQKGAKPGAPPERIVILVAKDILCRFRLPEEAPNVTVKG